VLTYMPIPYVVPAIAFMFGLWAAFWWIGRTPLTESLGKRLQAWVVGGAVAAMVGLIAFDPLLRIMDSRFQRAVQRELSNRNITAAVPSSRGRSTSDELPWRLFSLQVLEQLTAQRKTVFVDFTADW
jgi:thiol:disulfide interchange protein